MRHILVILMLIVLTMMPAFASQQTTVFDYSYRITSPNDMLGQRVDWTRQTVLISTQEEAPPQLLGERARAAAHALAFDAARGIFADYVNQMHLTSYATVSDAIFTGYLPAEGAGEARGEYTTDCGNLGPRHAEADAGQCHSPVRTRVAE